MLKLKQSDGKTLDEQQLAKLEREDEILLEISDILEAHPREAAAIGAEKRHPDAGQH